MLSLRMAHPNTDDFMLAWSWRTANLRKSKSLTKDKFKQHWHVEKLILKWLILAWLSPNAISFWASQLHREWHGVSGRPHILWVSAELSRALSVLPTSKILGNSFNRRLKFYICRHSIADKTWLILFIMSFIASRLIKWWNCFFNSQTLLACVFLLINGDWYIYPFPKIHSFAKSCPRVMNSFIILRLLRPTYW